MTQGTSWFDSIYRINRILKKKNWTKPDWLGGKVNNTGRVGGAPALPLDGRV